jgi:hypothetical protein
MVKKRDKPEPTIVDDLYVSVTLDEVTSIPSGLLMQTAVEIFDKAVVEKGDKTHEGEIIIV